MTRGVPPVLSFVIPVKNDARRLRCCLESIRANTGGIATEIIVADNGSTDDSAAVADTAGARVLHLPNRRVAEVRNQAAATATGEFLAFVDADQEIDPAWSEAAIQALAGPGVAGVGAQYHAPANGTWVQRTYDRLRRHRAGIHAVDWLPSGNLVVRRATFERIGGFDVSLETCEDVDLCQRLTRTGDQLLAVDRLRSIHHGDPATLKALFRGELWRGRDNLRVSLRVPLTLHSVPSLAAPLLTLAAIAAMVVGLAGWQFGGGRLVMAGAGWILILTAARAFSLMTRAPGGDRSAVDWVRTWVVAMVYDIARALALVARTGHTVRQKA